MVTFLTCAGQKQVTCFPIQPSYSKIIVWLLQVQLANLSRGEILSMSVNSTQQQSASREWADTDGIDLSRYISTLWKRWPEIVLTTLAVILLTALAVWAFKLLTPRIYEAIATVAIVRTSTDVSLDERFTTEQQSLDVDSRRMALIALVSSGEIAQQVIDELGDALPTSLQDPAALLDTIESEMALAGGRAGQSDLINIKARTDSPQTSALIANTWAKAYVQQVNNIYGKVPDELLASVEAQLAEAQQTYEQAQSRLESYVAASQLDELLHQSDAISNTLGVLQSTQLDAITSENDRLRSQLRLYNDQWLRTTGLLTAAHRVGRAGQQRDRGRSGQHCAGAASAPGADGQRGRCSTAGLVCTQPGSDATTNRTTAANGRRNNHRTSSVGCAGDSYHRQHGRATGLPAGKHRADCTSFECSRRAAGWEQPTRRQRRRAQFDAGKRPARYDHRRVGRTAPDAAGADRGRERYEDRGLGPARPGLGILGGAEQQAGGNASDACRRQQ